MFRSRLAIKIGLLIVVVLIIGFGVSTLVTIQRESAALVEQNKTAARRLTATLVASIEGAMLQGRPDVTRMMLKELKASSPVVEFMVYRRNGVEAFTDLATAKQVAKTGNLSKEVMENLTRMQRAPGATSLHRSGRALSPRPTANRRRRARSGRGRPPCGTCR